MHLYYYTVLEYEGTEITGHIVAQNKNSAITYLENTVKEDNYGFSVREISEIDGYEIILKSK